MPVSVIENASFGSSGIVTANGIKFPATQVASADANTLDDYEEGTWTPTFSDQGNVSSISISNATYTKVGRMVNCSMFGTITVTSSNTATYFGFTIPFISRDTATYPAGTVNISASSNNLGTVIDWSSATNDRFGIWINAASMFNSGSSIGIQIGFSYQSAS